MTIRSYIQVALTITLTSLCLGACGAEDSPPVEQTEQAGQTGPKLSNGKTLYLDVHDLGPGKVTAEAVAAAHLEDLAVQDQYGVSFKHYWVDEEAGKVYCLSEALNADSVVRTHAKAHGLLPTSVDPVVQGE